MAVQTGGQRREARGTVGWSSGGTARFPAGGSARGSVTAELAVVLPAVTALLALLLLTAAAATLQLRLEEGARAGARALARGESSAQATDTATRLAGGRVAVSVDLAGGYATVTLTGHATGVLSGIVPWQQSARATARIENYDPAFAAARVPAAQPAAACDGGRNVPAVGTLKTALWRWVNVPRTMAFAAGKYILANPLGSAAQESVRCHTEEASHEHRA
jgi:hypothetical protein